MESGAKRYCGCEGGSCLDGPTPCPHVDAQGFRIGAKRKLEPSKDGKFATDLETGELFHVRSNKKGKWLAPVFQDTVKWSTFAGFTRMMMVLSMMPEIDYSNMDWDWWQDNVKNVDSKLVIQCTKCGTVSNTTNIYHIMKGRAPGCWCTGGSGSWKSHGGFLKMMAILQQKYDHVTHEMDWVWWQTNVKNNKSKLMVTCKDCTWQCESILSKVVDGNAFPCDCKGNAPWSSKQGCDKFIATLAEKHSNMQHEINYEWWAMHITGGESKICVHCTTCGCDCKKSVRRAHANGFSCGCQGRLKSTTKYRHDEIMQMLLDKHPHMHHEMDWEWWQKNVKGSGTKLEVICMHCGWKCCTTSIAHFLEGHGFACECSGHGFWSSHQGHKRMLKVMIDKFHQYEHHMTWEWWQRNINNVSDKLEVQCKICGWKCCTTSIRHLVRNKGFACECNGGPWSSHQGYDRMMRLLAERHPNFSHSMDWEWWQSNIKNAFSVLVVTCQRCKRQCNRSQVHSINNGSGFGCGCRNKTEAKLEEWLKKQYPDNTLETQFTHDTCRNVNKLAFDFVVHFGQQRIFIELDGPQHFEHINFFSGQSNDKNIEHDLIKEKWVKSQGWCMIRVLQEDVWADRLGWDSFVKKSISRIQTDPTPRIITPPDTPEYLVGPYADARRCLF